MYPMLYGSSLLAPTIRIGKADVQLGDIVRRAYKDLGLSVDEWNSLEPLKREGLLAKAIYEMRAEADEAEKGQG